MTPIFGADIQTLLDTSLSACESACLSDSACQAYTFNSNKDACFLKNGIGEKSEFSGAWSAEIVATNPAFLIYAPSRRQELGFLAGSYFDDALSQVRRLPHEYVVGGWDLMNLRDGMRGAQSEANLVNAMRFAAGAVVLSDEASDWAEYARLSLALAYQAEKKQRAAQVSRPGHCGGDQWLFAQQQPGATGQFAGAVGRGAGGQRARPPGDCGLASGAETGAAR